MADLIHGNTQLGPQKADLIASLVQRELAFNASLMRTVTDVSSFAVKGAKSISFPKLSSFTVIDRTEGAQGDSSVLTATVDQLLLDKNAYVAWIVDADTLAQANINVEMELAARAAAAHGRYVDSQIIATLEAAGVATATAGNITRDIVLEMRESLLTRHANLAGLKLVVGPDQESELLKIAEFTRADIYGTSNIPSGVIGRVYGCEVMLHTGIGANTYYMYEASGLAVGFQSGPKSNSQPANEYGVGAVRSAMDMLFGTRGLQLGQQGVGATESALIVKDGN